MKVLEGGRVYREGDRYCGRGGQNRHYEKLSGHKNLVSAVGGCSEDTTYLVGGSRRYPPRWYLVNGGKETVT